MTGKPSARQKFFDTLLRLPDGKGQLSLSSVARTLGVTHSSLVKNLRELRENGIVESTSLGPFGVKIVILDRKALEEKTEGGTARSGDTLGRMGVIRPVRPISVSGVES